MEPIEHLADGRSLSPAKSELLSVRTLETAVVIGVWSDCVRPETTTAHPWQLVQWQANDVGISPELVLEDGTSLGQVRHVLEFHFPQPGTYRYHMRNSPQVLGTIVVR
jgi:hypothetical protein